VTTVCGAASAKTTCIEFSLDAFGPSIFGLWGRINLGASSRPPALRVGIPRNTVQEVKHVMCVEYTSQVEYTMWRGLR